jgi:hypothetical protein
MHLPQLLGLLADCFVLCCLNHQFPHSLMDFRHLTIFMLCQVSEAWILKGGNDEA